jgi:heme oxygenase (mycobilin-producing)
MFKVLIKRKVPAGKGDEVLKLVGELRSLVSLQKGYVSGETLRSVEKPDELLVISIWDTEEDWNRWIETEQRQNLQSKIDGITGSITTYEKYVYPHTWHHD